MWLRDTVRQMSLRKSVAGADLRSALWPLTSLGTFAWPYRVTTRYSYYIDQISLNELQSCWSIDVHFSWIVVKYFWLELYLIVVSLFAFICNYIMIIIKHVLVWPFLVLLLKYWCCQEPRTHQNAKIISFQYFDRYTYLHDISIEP